MRDFFERQDQARKSTRLLLILMALGVIAMSGAVYGLLWALYFAHHVALAPSPWQPDLFAVSLLGTFIVVAGASSLRVLSLRGGGARVAEMLGGRLVSGSPRDALEKRLVNVVEEMAIASGVPVPQVFVLDGEQGINAFAAGYTPADAVVAVTRGSLERLTRDELQGVIAHEFSHILNGDMRLNIRLMGVVFGIVCVSLLGRLLMRMTDAPRLGRRRERQDGRITLLLFLTGLGVFLIGLVGEFFGKLIRAAISRQREFLADASAVQFTRNPSGIAGALKKIGGWPAGASVRSLRAEEASHLFFGDIHRRLFGPGPLATHPPLEERIRRIEPSFDGQFPALEGSEPEQRALAEAEQQSLPAFAPFPSGPPVAPEHVVAQVGALSADGLARGRNVLASLPAALRDGAQSPFSACAIVYACLLSADATILSAQRGQIAKLSSPALETEALRYLASVRALHGGRVLAMVRLLAPALRQLSPEQRRVFSRTLDALVAADGKLTLFECVLAETLRARIEQESHAGRRSMARTRSLRAVRDELALLLSSLAYAGHESDAEAARAFAAGAARVPDLALVPLPRAPGLLRGVPQALSALRTLSPEPRARVVDAFAHCALADALVEEDEATLLVAACDALDCPLPPWLGGDTNAIDGRPA